ncbi:hypothetical protein [Arthrobacter sp. Helios]|uniref:hypothetical protein n=1 Tax=Arthrobacter sp. Helios TaxID=2828862 RepID=UPI00206BA493|nr:hypothetical protein [Arthrobacter sp. Helios]UPO78083.1 hypothetical protein ArtHe_05165 [Arthrobacter sp. Helios]
MAELADAVDCTSMEHIFDSEAQPTTPAAAPPPAAGSVPEGFVPVEVIRCGAALETIEDQDGLWRAVTQERLAGDLDALVAALTEPSDGPGWNQVCTADMELVPDLWLLAADGKAMRAAWPTDSCGKTKPGVHGVLAEMDVVEVSQHKTALIQSRAALDAGCPEEWSLSTWPGATALAPIMTDVEDAAKSGGETVPASPGVLPSAEDIDTLRICHYRTAPAPSTQPRPGTSAGLPGSPQPEQPFDLIESVSGTFSGGGNLTGPSKDALLQTAAAEPSGAECGEPATGFAALWPVAQGRGAGAPLTLELDGCRRLVGFDGSARTVPAELITAVVTALGVAETPR